MEAFLRAAPVRKRSGFGGKKCSLKVMIRIAAHGEVAEGQSPALNCFGNTY